MTTTALELRRSIENCELPHEFFNEHHTVLKRRIDDTLDGLAPRVEWVIGPSRVGKSMLLNALASDYPAQRVGNVREVPVLTVPVLSSISSKLLPISVLTALGVPLPQRGLTSGVMFNRMLEQLRLAKTKVLLWEEASHLVEPGSRVPPRAAGDWFKDLHEQLGVTLILFGVPRLQKLFESNEQLRCRASARREFRPYSYMSVPERQSFTACVHTYAEIFKKAGWPIQVDLQSLVNNCYLLCGGLVGVLSRFMQELACLMTHQSPRAVTYDDCALAAQAIETPSTTTYPPFSGRPVTAVELNKAHEEVLRLNGMTLRPLATTPTTITSGI